MSFVGAAARTFGWLVSLGCLVACSGEPDSRPGGGDGGTAPGGGGGNAGGAESVGGGGGGPVAGAGAQGGSPSLGGDAGAGGTPSGGSGGGPSVPMFPKLLDDCDTAAAHEQADAALASMLVHFWSGAEQYLYATSNPGELTGYWTYAQAFDALLDGVERTGSLRYRGLVRTFFEGRAERGWLVDFFDDESWMALALMRAYDLTGEQLYLDQAELLFQDIMEAWDTTCCGEHLGGIWWNRQHEQKATASNAGPVIAGVRLAARTQNPEYLAFARQTYDFWWEHMVNQETFAIYDHLNPDGSRAPGALTYNHGIMIGAALELHAATGEPHFLVEAHGFGEYMSTVATRDSEVGPLLHDAIGQSCDGDCPAWKGIGYRYLADLFRQDPTRSQYREVLTAGATGIWTLARNPQSNFFATNWAGPAPTVGGIEEQGSAVMALNQYAMLCGSTGMPVHTPGRYEAEEGWLDHVALEALYAGFSGFGYVAAFMNSGQSVTFEVEVPAAGDYRLDWTYSAAAGDAQRTVRVDGEALTAAQPFPTTGAWDSWSTSSTDVTLPAGRVTITLAREAGDAGGINLDRLDLLAR